MRSILVTVLLALSLPLFAETLISVTGSTADQLDDAGNVTLTYVVRNVTSFDMPHVSANFDLQPGFVFVGARRADCRQIIPPTWQCTLPSIAAGHAIDFDVILTPPATHGHFAVETTVSTTGTGFFSAVLARARIDLYAEHVVTTTADDGSGSLRQAIIGANADGASPSVPCRITFAIREPLPERGWYSIEPRSPLPPIEASEIVVDGQLRNSVPIEIRGTHTSSDGLVFRGRLVTLNGLSIDGFFNNGVVLSRNGSVLITNNVIGSDPGGAPVPNGLRGITVDGAAGTIRDNVLSGNARSGIFATSTLGLQILSNRITGNGASGIYVGPTVYEVNVQGNTISGNHEFAIGIDRNATRVAVRENVMLDNGAPFDIGMNGPEAGALPPGPPYIEPRPSISSAVYDAASGDTVIAIDVHPLHVYADTYTLYVFANHGVDRAGRAEAETFLGTVSTQTDSTVVFRAHADLRGQLITALTMRANPFDPTAYVSSELSDGVLVR